MPEYDAPLTDAVVAARTGAQTVSQALGFFLRVKAAPRSTDEGTLPLPSPVVYSYDGQGRISRVEYGAPVVRTRTLTRNAAGRVTALVDAWAAGTRTCTFAYDAVGRRTQVACVFEEASP